MPNQSDTCAGPIGSKASENERSDVDVEQLSLSRDLLDLMRKAAGYAGEDHMEFITPPHVLLALLDDPAFAEAVGEDVDRERVLDAAKEPQLPEVFEIPEGPLPEGESAPFKRYDTLIFHSVDGSTSAWLDKQSFRMFIEGARRVAEGQYKPRHLALGYVSEALKDRQILDLFGKEPQTVNAKIYAMT